MASISSSSSSPSSSSSSGCSSCPASNATVFALGAFAGAAAAALAFKLSAKSDQGCKVKKCNMETKGCTTPNKAQQEGGTAVKETRFAAFASEFSLDAVVRDNISCLVPYRCARDDYNTGILLDANENTYGPSVPGTEVLARELERYPSPYQWELRQLYADWRGVQKENIFVGVGSDEAIDMLQRMVCVPKQDRILILPPTYGMYKVCAAVNDIGVDSVSMSQEFQFDTDAVLAAITPTTKIVFICSPNNPTANDVDRAEIIRLLDSEYQGLVVVDEAYGDFSDLPSCATLVSKYPNLVVLQTFSKSWGLAGIRCGVAIGHPKLVETLNKMKAPYNLNKVTSKVAVMALKNLDGLRKTVAVIKNERTRVAAALTSLKHVKKVFPSNANFIMFRVPNAKQVYLDIAADGVVIRYRGDNLHCEDCLRACVGTPEENDKLIEKLAAITERHAAEATAATE